MDTVDLPDYTNIQLFLMSFLTRLTKPTLEPT